MKNSIKILFLLLFSFLSSGLNSFAAQQNDDAIIKRVFFQSSQTKHNKEQSPLFESRVETDENDEHQSDDISDDSIILNFCNNPKPNSLLFLHQNSLISSILTYKVQLLKIYIIVCNFRL